MAFGVSVVLDLFAGVGVGVACRDLGLKEWAVENSAPVQAIRTANGMETEVDDVWQGIDNPDLIAGHDIEWASPPCQPFSMAGKGAGRAAFGTVMRLVDERAFLRPADMRAFGAEHDERTALVLTPMTYVYDHMPRAIVLEQVPTVLPLWQAFEPILRDMGYSTVSGNLQAEQYGVPQTRKRAILIARLDAEARMPTPTHSRFYPRDPKRLDPGVLPWVSMANALGWGQDDVTLRSNYGSGGDPAARGVRTIEQPAPTVTSKVDRNRWVTEERQRNVNVAEAAALQSFPADFVWPSEAGKGAKMQTIGNAVPPLLARALLAEVTT